MVADPYILYEYQFAVHVLFGGIFIQSYINSLLPQRRAALQQRLSGDITDLDRTQLQGELEEMKGIIEMYVSWIHQYEEGIHDFENEIARAEERQRKEGEGSKELYIEQ